MSLLKSSNPALTEKKFESEIAAGTYSGEVMTVRGTLNKFGFLTIMLVGSSFYSWKEFAEGGNVMPLILIGALGGLGVAILFTFKKTWGQYLAPLYALLEGLFIGAISAMFSSAFAEKAPNLIINAVGLTFGVALGMFFMYRAGIIKATEKFKSIIISATVGIAIFYMIVLALRLFGFTGMAFLHEGSPIGILFSLVVVAVAALNLILDFDMIDKGSEMGAPKYMEWYGAFGLMVTIVWLYIEILRLLSKLSSRN